MSWSLEIENGDLSFAGAGMGTVEGAAKLVQDLRCAVLEPMGTDPMHPGFGSTIDGGVMPDGTYTQGIIGQPNDAYAAAYVQSDIERIAQQYQSQQQARYQQDVATYGKGTITADEALLSVEQVSTSASQNQLLVQATLQTGTGSQPAAIPMTMSTGS